MLVAGQVEDGIVSRQYQYATSTELVAKIYFDSSRVNPNTVAGPLLSAIRFSVQSLCPSYYPTCDGTSSELPSSGMRRQMQMPFEVFGLGSNGSGQLGIGHLSDVSVPTRSCIQFGPYGSPKTIAAGGNHTLLLCTDGALYATGQNEDGRCATKARLDCFTEFQQVLLPRNGLHSKFKLCSATWQASCLVTTENLVYTCGSGNKGELGHGPDVTLATTPQAIPDFPPRGAEIVDLAACVTHTVAVLSNGEVYGWGSGRKGQLGVPPAVVWAPRKIEGINFKAVRAVCGRDFSYIVGPSNTGVHMVLGSDKWSIRKSAPISVTHWKDVTASWGSILVLFEDARLVGWGRDDHGQLPPMHLQDVCVVKAGSEHVIARDSQQKTIAWGWGEHGNCGSPVKENGDVADQYNVIVDDMGFSPLGSGCATSWLMRERDSNPLA